MTPRSRWSRRRDVFERVTPTGLLLLGDGEAPLRLAGPAVAVWDLLDDPIGIDELVDRLADTYHGDRNTMHDNTLDTLRVLAAEGLVREGMVSKGMVSRGMVDEGPAEPRP